METFNFYKAASAMRLKDFLEWLAGLGEPITTIQDKTNWFLVFTCNFVYVVKINKLVIRFKNNVYNECFCFLKSFSQNKWNIFKPVTFNSNLTFPNYFILQINLGKRTSLNMLNYFKAIDIELKQQQSLLLVKHPRARSKTHELCPHNGNTLEQL